MTITTHEIKLTAESKSKAKILRMPLDSYLVGKEFEVLLEVTNVGSAFFPGGKFKVSITWPNGQTVEEDIQIPPLNPSEASKTSRFTTNALCRGFALFTLESLPANDGKRISFRKASGESIPSGPPGKVHSFYSILANEPEEIYEFWGMIIAATSLAFLAVIELIRFIIWFGTLQ